MFGSAGEFCHSYISDGPFILFPSFYTFSALPKSITIPVIILQNLVTLCCAQQGPANCGKSEIITCGVTEGFWWYGLMVGIVKCSTYSTEWDLMPQHSFKIFFYLNWKKWQFLGFFSQNVKGCTGFIAWCVFLPKLWKYCSGTYLNSVIEVIFILPFLSEICRETVTVVA